MANVQFPEAHILDDVLERAATDLDFRRELLVDPNPVLLRAFGITVPDAFRLRFIEKPDELDRLIVLPDVRPPIEEIDDDELDAAAGGTGGGSGGGDGDGGDGPSEW